MTLFPQSIWHCRPGDMITDRGRTPPGQAPYLPPKPPYMQSPFQQQTMQSPIQNLQRPRAYSTWQSFPVRPPSSVYFDHVAARWVEQPSGIVVYDMKGELATFMGQYQSHEQQNVWQGFGQTYQQPYYSASRENGQSSFSSSTYTERTAEAQSPIDPTYTDSDQSPFNPSQTDSALYSASTIRCLPRDHEGQKAPDTPSKSPCPPIKQEVPTLAISPTIIDSAPSEATSPRTEPPLSGFSNIISASMLQKAVTANPTEVFEAISALSRSLEKTKFALATTQENFYNSRSDYTSMRTLFEQLIEIGEQKLILAYKMMERLREGDLRVISDQELIKRVQTLGVGMGVGLRPGAPMMKTDISTSLGMKGVGFQDGGGYQVKGPNGWFVPGANGGTHMTPLHEENSAGKGLLGVRTEIETPGSRIGSISPDKSDFSRGRSHDRKRGAGSKSPRNNAWKGKGKEERHEDNRGRMEDMKGKHRENQGPWDITHGQSVEPKGNEKEKRYSDIGVSVGQVAGKVNTLSSAGRVQSNDTRANGKAKGKEMFNPNARTFTPLQPAAPFSNLLSYRNPSAELSKQTQSNNFKNVSDEYQQAALAHSVLLNAITTIPARFYNICPHNLTATITPPVSHSGSLPSITSSSNTTNQPCPLSNCKLQRLCPDFNSVDGNKCKAHNGYCPMAHEKPTCRDQIDGSGCIYLRKGAFPGRSAFTKWSEKDVGEKHRHLVRFAHWLGPLSVTDREWRARETVAGLRVAHDEGKY